MKKINQITVLVSLLLLVGPLNSIYSQEGSFNRDSIEYVIKKDGNLNDVGLPYNKTTDILRTTSPVTVITGEELSRYPTNNLMEALTGLIPGMRILKTNYEPGGSNDVSLLIRGFNYTTIVDGVERSLNNLSPDEVESVSVLRGMSARANYGYPAADGLIVVKTKRGQRGQNEISANVEYGLRAVDQNRIPRWLNAYDYATMFNKAAINDGASPDDPLDLPYSPEYLEGYRTGKNPLKYFDEDLYSQVFNNTMDYKRMNVNYGGGSESTNYFFNLNYFGEGGGYLKHKSTTYDKVSLRSNVDVDINEDFRFSLDALASIEMRKFPLDMGSVWPVLSGYPVNAYPVEIAQDTFGTHPTFSRNPVADLIKRDYRNRLDRSGQVNAGFEYNLGKYIKGLSVDAYLSYDVYNYIEISHKRNFSYAMYEPVWITTPAGTDSMYLIQYGENRPDAGAARTGDRFTSRIGGFVDLNYRNSFGKHEIWSNLNGYLQSITRQGNPIDDRRVNFSYSGNYTFDQKYYLDVIMSLTGHQNIHPDNRFKLFPTVGFGWMLSEEEFIQKISFIDRLKLRASYGTQGFYNSGNPFLYETRWRSYGNTNFEMEPGGSQVVGRQRVYVDHDGNPELGWGTLTEFDAGIDGVFFKEKISIQLDYFNMERTGYILPATVPDIIGLTNFYSNVGAYKYYGVDGSVSYKVNLGDFHYTISFNGGYNNSEVLADNLPTYQYEWLNRIGNPTDAIYGFEAIGLFEDQEDIDGSPLQTYGAVFPGNIKYADLNEDSAVTSNFDQKMIGHSNPRLTYGAQISIGYKNIGLYVMGYGMSRRDVSVQSNNYYHQDGYDKYSEYIMENAWTTDNPDPEALHPRLTTASFRNDNLNSTYWLRNAGFFKIKNVELSYTLPKSVISNFNLSNLKFFVRGANLLTFSEIKELDPENLNLGVNTYPSMRTFTGGVSLNF